MALTDSTQNGIVAIDGPGRLSAFWRGATRFYRRSPLGAVGAAIILSLVLMAIIGPYVAPYDPPGIGHGRKVLKSRLG